MVFGIFHPYKWEDLGEGLERWGYLALFDLHLEHTNVDWFCTIVHRSTMDCKIQQLSKSSFEPLGQSKIKRSSLHIVLFVPLFLGRSAKISFCHQFIFDVIRVLRDFDATLKGLFSSYNTWCIRDIAVAVPWLCRGCAVALPPRQGPENLSQAQSVASRAYGARRVGSAAPNRIAKYGGAPRRGEFRRWVRRSDARSMSYKKLENT